MAGKSPGNRLKRVLAKVILKAHNALIEGRQILNATPVANEAFDSILRSKKGVVLCKLDIEKSYDHVDCFCLCLVLEKIGLGSKWIGWIRWCISTASFSLLFNGTPAGFIKNTRVLRQGDPLSPYLFVIAMKAFN